jgi:hypothetical protein
MWKVIIKFRDGRDDMVLSNLKEVHYNYDGRGYIAFEEEGRGNNMRFQEIKEFEAKEVEDDDDSGW